MSFLLQCLDKHQKKRPQTCCFSQRPSPTQLHHSHDKMNRPTPSTLHTVNQPKTEWWEGLRWGCFSQRPSLTQLHYSHDKMNRPTPSTLHTVKQPKTEWWEGLRMRLQSAIVCYMTIPLPGHLKQWGCWWQGGALVLGFLGQEYFQRHPGVGGGSPHLLVVEGGRWKGKGEGREKEGEEREKENNKTKWGMTFKV